MHAHRGAVRPGTPHWPAQPVKVSVAITTFNHGAFIEDAIRSVINQIVDFEYEVVVGDDCSTDDTREKLLRLQQNYSDKISLVFPDKHIGGNRLVEQVMAKCRGEYVAWLDGDDYWTSPHKLIKQARFLDFHPDIAVCFHDALVVSDMYNEQWELFTGPDWKSVSDVYDLLEKNYIASASPMLRRKLILAAGKAYYDDRASDTTMICMVAQHGNIGYINEPMAVYRIHAGGMWSGMSREEKLRASIEGYGFLRSHLDRKYIPLIDRCIKRHRMQLAVEQANIPIDGTLVVMSGGDDAFVHRGHDGLLRFGWRLAQHFPQNDDGTYRGNYRVNDTELFIQLMIAQRRGAQYLLVPFSQQWWLKKCSRFREHLEVNYPCLWDDDTCIIFQFGLRTRQGLDRGLEQANIVVGSPGTGGHLALR